MSKSQNTIDEQQKDLCITSEQLTEKWKKGELPEETECYVRVNGDIYLGSIQYKNGSHNKKLPYVKSFNGQFITKYVEEVLAPVPSYDELQNMNKAVNECMAANIKLVEQNKQLKEQINKYCLDAINRGTANAVKAVKEFGMPERIKELVEQNTKLKELLRELKRYFDKGGRYYIEKRILLEINQVLADNKIQANNIACNKISLTEKWKKGELLEDFYYVRCAWSDEVETRYVHNGVDDWQEIIAEVPSYDEWQEYKDANDSMFDTIKMLNKDNYKLENENTKLKELLKELKRYFDKGGRYYIEKRILLEINQVLGEE